MTSPSTRIDAAIRHLTSAARSLAVGDRALAILDLTLAIQAAADALGRVGAQ